LLDSSSIRDTTTMPTPRGKSTRRLILLNVNAWHWNSPDSYILPPHATPPCHLHLRVYFSEAFLPFSFPLSLHPIHPFAAACASDNLHNDRLPLAELPSHLLLLSGCTLVLFTVRLQTFAESKLLQLIIKKCLMIVHYKCIIKFNRKYKTTYERG
jgi:hypothetical protein